MTSMVLAACTDASTEPLAPRAPQPARFSIAGATGGSVVTFESTRISSAQARLVSTLADREFAAKVDASVATFKTQLDAGDATAARVTIAATRALVDEYTRAPKQGTSIADLAALDLELAAVERMLAGG
jgi:hypothetical protein